MCAMTTEPANPVGELDELDVELNKRAAGFKKTGSGYAVEQATRPSTIGLILASNPLAILAWYLPPQNRQFPTEVLIIVGSERNSTNGQTKIPNSTRFSKQSLSTGSPIHFQAPYTSIDK